jgi:hypothetical protein
MVTPRLSGRASRVSAASFGDEGQVDRFPGKERWSVRLSSSSASVRSMARAVTT